MLCITCHNNTNTQTPQESFSFFGKLPKIMFEHPYIATLIATLVSLFSAKRLFSRSPYTPTNTNIKITTITSPQQTNHIDDSKNTILYDCKTKRLTITRTDQPPIVIEHVTHYHPSKNMNYFIAHQLKKRTGLKKILKNLIFHDPDISDVYKFLQQYMYETLLINTVSGEIISLGSAISVEFNKDENELIILESHEPSFATILCNRILTKLWITSPIKTTPNLEHKIFSLDEKKYISLPERLINKQAVFFSSSQDVVIIDKQATTSWSKNSAQPSTNDENNHAIIKYFLNEDTNTYQLSLLSTQNTTEQIFDNVHYFYTTPDKNYLILYKIKNVQMIQSKTLLPDATKEDFITFIQNTSTKTCIIDTKSGRKEYTSRGIIICTPYGDENNHLYILQQNDPTIGSINLEHILKNKDDKQSFDDNHALVISSDNKLQLLDSDDNPIDTQTVVQKAESFFKNAAQKIENIIPRTRPKTISAPIYSTQMPDVISYYDYTYVGEKSANDNKTKKSYQKALAKGICGFEWNIYDFTKASFKTLLNTLKGPPSAIICITNKTPNEMDYCSYKSLQAELAKVLAFIKQNDNAIITIFLNNNDCDNDLIDDEISKTLQHYKYDPLLRPQPSPQGTIIWPAIKDMYNLNKRLIFFNTTDKNSTMTHSMKYANHKILSFFDDNAVKKPQLFELANQENQRQIVRTKYS